MADRIPRPKLYSEEWLERHASEAVHMLRMWAPVAELTYAHDAASMKKLLAWLKRDRRLRAAWKAQLDKRQRERLAERKRSLLRVVPTREGKGG